MNETAGRGITEVLREMSEQLPKLGSPAAGRLLETICLNLGTADALHTLTKLSREDEFFSILGTDGQIVKSIINTALASFAAPLLGEDGEGIPPADRAKLLDTELEFQKQYKGTASQPHTLLSLNTPNSKGNEMSKAQRLSTAGLDNLSVDADQLAATIFGKAQRMSTADGNPYPGVVDVDAIVAKLFKRKPPAWHDNDEISPGGGFSPLAGSDPDSDSDQDAERLVNEIFGKSAANPVRT